MALPRPSARLARAHLQMPSCFSRPRLVRDSMSCRPARVPERFEGGLGLRAPTTRRVPRSPWPPFRPCEPRFACQGTSGSTSGMCWKRVLTTGRSLPYRARPRSPRSVHPVLAALRLPRRRPRRVKLRRLCWQVHGHQNLLGDGFALDQGDQAQRSLAFLADGLDPENPA